MPHRSRKNPGQRVHKLYSWHRWLGISAALFVIVLALSGLALNHSEALGLDRTGLRAGLWHRLYHLDDKVDIASWSAGRHWLAYSEGRLYFDNRFVTRAPRPLGIVKIGDLRVVASPAELLLLDSHGSLLEQIGADRLPGRITGFASRGRQLLVQTPYARFSGNLDNLDWQLLPASSPAPEFPAHPLTPLPESLRQSISRDVRSQRLTLERLLLDLHSGRLFGRLGRFVMDAAALAMLALALTGPWLWLRLRRRLRKRRLKPPAG